MRIKEEKFIYESFFTFFWTFKTFNNNLALVAYEKYTGKVCLNIGKFINISRKTFRGPNIFVEKIESNNDFRNSWIKIKKIIENIPEELLDMILKLKGY